MKTTVKLSKSLSLKWQLSIALIGLAMGLVAFYVWLAKETFESDKIAYVFETRQLQLESSSKEIFRKLERGISDANSVLIGFDQSSKQLNTMAQKLFDSQRTLLAVEVTDGVKQEPLIQIFKVDSLKESLAQAVPMPTGMSFFATALDSSRYLIMTREKSDSSLFIKAIVEIPEVLLTKDARGLLMLIEGNRVLATTRKFDIPENFVRELSQDRLEKTMVRKIGSENYLISALNVDNSDLKLVSFDPESLALGAIGILYRRSIVFIAFSGFLTMLLALLISTGLTQKLKALTVIAGEIGKGDFSHKPEVTSKDEVGVLQAAFLRMSDEIQKLIMATKEKTRMEEELFVVVADATGHGTPAALCTAASRSLFANLERNANLTLKDIAIAWDRSIAASSGQKVFMTAFMIKLNTWTGKGSALSASHEAPLLFKPNVDAEFLNIDRSATIGELSKNWQEVPFELAPGERFFLFTDGLWAIENAEKKTFSESRFTKKLSKVSANENGPEDFLKAIDAVIQDHRQGTTYPDDVTLVVIDRLAS